MKNIVRVFVVALALTAAAAYTHSSSATTTATPKMIAAVVQPDLMPAPSCEPSDDSCSLR